jgi:CMP-N-acetylneuraminic acid synthetase|tara:strand:+ start:10 stop:756 length:747 start_codon:yes stop_codon:yes gene_type:complete
MICALMIGRAGSAGFPNKNIRKVLGRRLCEYPLIACKNSKYVNKIFVSTDCPIITRTCKNYDAIHIKRPRRLTNNKALGEHVFEHGYFEIKKILNLETKDIEFIVLLMANAPTVSGKLIDKGISVLKRNKNFNSAVTTSIYNMWSPLRARKINKRGFLKPFVPFKTFGNPKTLNCDRDSQGDVYYADMSASIVRPRCLENLKEGLLPQKWMGKKIAAIKSWGGCDVDYEWQIPGVEYWLKKHGFPIKD